jgi:hypothetical protein
MVDEFRRIYLSVLCNLQSDLCTHLLRDLRDCGAQAVPSRRASMSVCVPRQPPYDPRSWFFSNISCSSVALCDLFSRRRGVATLKLARSILQLFTAAIFNSEVLSERWRMLNPAPLTFVQFLSYVAGACGSFPSRHAKRGPAAIPRPLKSSMRPSSTSDLSLSELEDAVGDQASLALSVSSGARLPAHAHAANIRERSRLRRQQRKEREQLLAGLTHEERVQVNVIRATARVREETALRLSMAGCGMLVDGDSGPVASGLLPRPRADSEVSSLTGSDVLSQESPYLGPVVAPQSRTPSMRPLALSAASPLLTPMITPLVSSVSNPGTVFVFPEEGMSGVRPSTSEARLNTVTRPPLNRHSSLLGATSPPPCDASPSSAENPDGDGVLVPDLRPGTAPDRFRHHRTGSVVGLLTAATTSRKGSLQLPIKFSTENHKHRHGRSASSVSLNLVLDPVEIAAVASAVSASPSPEVPAVGNNTRVNGSVPCTPIVSVQTQSNAEVVLPTFPVASVSELRQLEADFATAV